LRLRPVFVPDVVVDLVVVPLRIKGRVYIAEIDSLILDVPTKYVEVVAIVKKIRLHERHLSSTRS
jgi:hypothetical protein